MAHFRVRKIVQLFCRPTSTVFKLDAAKSAENASKHISFIDFSPCCRWNSRQYCTNIFGSTNFGEFDLSNYSKLATSPEAVKEIKMILLEYELAKQSDCRVPSEITETDMQQLLNESTQNGRLKYFRYLGTREFCKVSGKKKKEERRKIREEIIEQRRYKEPSKHIEYGIGRNSMLPRIQDSSLEKTALSRLIHAATFELPLVFDLSFEYAMSDKDIRNTATQIQYAFAANRKSTEPFDVCFCNFQRDSKLSAELERFLPNLYSPVSMITVKEKDYLNLYPKEKIVYLTPDSRHVLNDFKTDKIYVIGGLVDTGASKPLTLAKAKRQGIETAKLPLDKYLLWGLGRKSLTLDQMMSILLEWKKTSDWKKALQFVPKRFLKTSEDLLKEEQARMKKFTGY